MKNLTRFCAIIALCTTPALALAGNEGDCCVANGTPGCNDADCQEVICAADAFCCNNNWDGICAEDAQEICFVCGGSGCGDSDAGSCYSANPTSGCDDADCCQLVCANDPYCCDNQWDGFCAGDAAVMCGSCGNENAGSCCQANGTPGCNDADCCEVVCAGDAFCCDNNWDALCASDANAVCGLCGFGACCLGNECVEMPQTQCIAIEGNYVGDGVGCDEVGCVQIDIGACCVNGSCSIIHIDSCIAQGGTFGGIGALCSEIDCECTGDTNGDGNVDSFDLNIVLSNFGCASFECAGDLDGNDFVNSIDLNIVLANFGCFN
jgi:hypothetical protein